ncbi:hypothetical protein ACX1NT_09970 [Acinetobacter sp. ANC 5584]
MQLILVVFNLRTIFSGLDVLMPEILEIAAFQLGIGQFNQPQKMVLSDAPRSRLARIHQTPK